MISLTTPAAVPGELGASSANSFGKLRIMSILADPVTQAISAQVQLLDTANTNLPAIIGTLVITTQGNSPQVAISVPALNIQSVVPLTGGEQTTVQGWITVLQNAIEAGLVGLGLIAGTQSTGV
jgi:hypothetical protein